MNKKVPLPPQFPPARKISDWSGEIPESKRIREVWYKALESGDYTQYLELLNDY